MKVKFLQMLQTVIYIFSKSGPPITCQIKHKLGHCESQRYGGEILSRNYCSSNFPTLVIMSLSLNLMTLDVRSIEIGRASCRERVYVLV